MPRSPSSSATRKPPSIFSRWNRLILVDFFVKFVNASEKSWLLVVNNFPTTLKNAKSNSSIFLSTTHKFIHIYWNKARNHIIDVIYYKTPSTGMFLWAIITFWFSYCKIFLLYHIQRKLRPCSNPIRLNCNDVKGSWFQKNKQELGIEMFKSYQNILGKIHNKNIVEKKLYD